ncbi:MAG: ankyrin repeat domain-containing protein, partial [Ottowia sp.]|nr:ankyrin repeat domain-containing protein [Ottowia sp.]
TVQLLLERGADAGATSADGATAMSLAQSNGHAEVVQLLIAAEKAPE